MEVRFPGVIHVIPPMKAPEAVRNSPLPWQQVIDLLMEATGSLPIP